MSVLYRSRRQISSLYGRSSYLPNKTLAHRNAHFHISPRPQHSLAPMPKRTKTTSRSISSKPDARDYVYTPLDTAEGSMRLLRLLPSTDPSSPLRCSLIHTTLEAAPPYVALSYAWGDNREKHPILISDETLYVTPSLSYALQRLRPTIGVLVMWVDAICINQQDIPERNLQTANMRSIYQNAESVAVWLGLEYRDSAGALKIVRELNACTSFEEEHEIITDPANEPLFGSLVRLFRRQYYWRIWIIQEVSCGKRSTVYCGAEEISWDDMENTCSILESHEDSLQAIFYKNPSILRTLTKGGPRALQLSRYSSSVDAPPLLEILISHKSKKSSDPKDKVYALVGISSSRLNYGKIDYSQTLAEVYRHTAQHIISTTNKLDLICVKQHDTPLEGLPSWAPDWKRPLASSGATVIGLHHHEPAFKAAGDTLAEMNFLYEASVLQTSCIVLDTVSATGIPLKRKGSPGDPLPALHAFHDWWNLFSAKHSSSPSAQAIFARTIACGNWQFDDDDTYVAKLETIFNLSDGLLSESDILRMDPPSRSSTISRSATMTDSVQSMGEFEDEDVDPEEVEQFSTILSVAVMMNRRRLILTDGGKVGLGPWNTAEGDLICILPGCRFPVALRGIRAKCVLIGEVYMDGYMNGEGIEALEDGRLSKGSFHIY